MNIDKAREIHDNQLLEDWNGTAARRRKIDPDYEHDMEMNEEDTASDE